MGLQVDLAANGQQAVDLARGRDYDLILMDVQMPSLDGLEATRILRGGGLTTPIIALTGRFSANEKPKSPFGIPLTHSQY